MTQKKSNPAAAKKALDLGKSALLKNLKDAGSANFRRLFVYNDVFYAVKSTQKIAAAGMRAFNDLSALEKLA